MRHGALERRLYRRNAGGSVGGGSGRLECHDVRVLYGRGASQAARVDDRGVARTAAAAGKAHRTHGGAVALQVVQHELDRISGGGGGGDRRGHALRVELKHELKWNRRVSHWR